MNEKIKSTLNGIKLAIIGLALLLTHKNDNVALVGYVLLFLAFLS